MNNALYLFIAIITIFAIGSAYYSAFLSSVDADDTIRMKDIRIDLSQKFDVKKNGDTKAIISPPGQTTPEISIRIESGYFILESTVNDQWSASDGKNYAIIVDYSIRLSANVSTEYIIEKANELFQKAN